MQKPILKVIAVLLVIISTATLATIAMGENSHRYFYKNIFKIAAPELVTCPTPYTGNVSPTTCMTDVTVNAPTSNCAITSMSYTIAGVTTNLSAPFPSTVFLGSLGVSSFTIRWDVVDCLGLRVCNQPVLITDNTAPSLTCVNIFTPCTVDDEPPYPDYNTFIMSSGNSASDACGINPDSFMLVSTQLVAGSQPPQYCRVYSIKDIHNNAATCTQKIIVEDLESPSITCPSNITVGNNESGRRTLVTVGQPNVDDNCGILSVINDYNNTDDASDDYPVGTTMVCWTVTDVNGNTNFCCQSITVVDNTPPVIMCPPTIFEQCEVPQFYTSYQAFINAGGSATDETALDTLEFTWVIDEGFDGTCLDTVFRKYAIADTNMNWDTCTQLIIIHDTTPPTANCFSDVTVSLDADGNFKPTASAFDNGSVDNCGGDLMFSFTEVVCFACNNVLSGTPVLVTLVVTDECGNSSTCEISFTIVDDIFPTIQCPDNVTVNSSPGLCSGIVDTDPPIVDDNCDSFLTVGSMYNGNAITFPTTLPVGSNLITWTVTDIGGNSTQCTQTIVVIDVEFPEITCPSPITVSTDEDVCYATNVNLGTPTITDNCPGSTATVTLGGTEVNATTHFNIGENTVIWIVTDASGHTATCEQIVTVEDNQIPEVSCPATATANTDSGQCSATNVGLGLPTVTDNCGANSQVYFNNVLVTPMTSFPIDTSIVIWIVTDAAGNSASCSQYVVVSDNEDPSLSCNVGIVPADLNQNCQVVIPDVLYTITASDNCTLADTSQFPIENSLIVSSHGQLHTVVVTVTDNFGNSATCSLQVQAEDNLGPDITCQDPRIVSISGNPDLTAESFIDHATDNCGGPITFQVKRMAGECGTGMEDDFGPEIEICCDDVGQSIVVIVEASDQHNNKSTCMTSVIVGDEIAPEIDEGSLPDITISCEYPLNLNNLSVFGTLVELHETRNEIIIIDPNNPFYPDSLAGYDGVYSDNCPGALVSSSYRDSTGMCNTGKIYRDFVVTDVAGNTATYTQIINVKDVDPFDENDITWPSENVDYFDCNDNDPDTLITGRPFLNIDHCSLVGATYKDEIFYIPDNCKLIRRTWTVLDWCQYVTNSGSNTGKWTFVQNINVKNTTPPTIDSGVCQDVTVCTQNNGCTANLTYSATGTDDCLPVNIKWWYELDLNNNGTIDVKSNGSSIQRTYEIGTHKLKWYAKDGCGNTSSCMFTFVVRDCKAPTALAMQGLALNLSPPMGMNSLWASDFNNFSSDNCTPTSQLKFSFSSDVNDNFRTYNCDSLGKRTVELWVTDLAGNQSRAKTYVIVQDNFNLCNTTGTKVSISGHIFTEDKKMIPETKVKLDGGVTEGTFMTSNDGDYRFEGLEKFNDYTLLPEKDNNYLSGVSTLDLVLMQRHILGVERLNSPYKLIAADVNRSNSISVSDLSELRKLILGIQTKFSNNTSWRFIDASYQFEDKNKPWNYVQSMAYSDLSQSMSNSDFIGMKIGDVNNDAFNVTSPTTQSRSAQDYILYTEDAEVKKGNIVSVPLKLENSDEPIAIQFTLELSEDVEYIGIESADFQAFDSENVGYVEREGRKYITVSYFDLYGINTSGGNTLFNVICKAKKDGSIGRLLKMSNDITTSEIVDHELQKRSLSFVVREIEDDFGTLFGSQNEPNPFINETIVFVGLDEPSTVQISLFTADGRLLFESSDYYSKGSHQISLTSDQFKGAKGIILCKIKTSSLEQVIKMLRIE